MSEDSPPDEREVDEEEPWLDKEEWQHLRFAFYILVLAELLIVGGVYFSGGNVSRNIAGYIRDKIGGRIYRAINGSPDNPKGFPPKAPTPPPEKILEPFELNFDINHPHPNNNPASSWEYFHSTRYQFTVQPLAKGRLIVKGTVTEDRHTLTQIDSGTIYKSQSLLEAWDIELELEAGPEAITPDFVIEVCHPSFNFNSLPDGTLFSSTHAFTHCSSIDDSEFPVSIYDRKVVVENGQAKTTHTPSANPEPLLIPPQRRTGK